MKVNLFTLSNIFSLLAYVASGAGLTHSSGRRSSNSFLDIFNF